MKAWLSASVAGIALLAGPALAADMPVKTVVKAPDYVWTGCFIGGNGGGVFAHKDWAANPTGTSYGNLEADGWVAGAQIGCDYQVGQWVFGVQGDYDWTNAKGSSSNLAIVTLSQRAEIKSVASVTGRVGFASYDRFLIYVRGGVAWERDNYDQFVTATRVTTTTASETRTGYTVGLGGEYAFTSYLSGFVEGNWYGFGTRTNSFTPVGGGAATLIDIREQKGVARAGLNLRFGGGPVMAKY